jgi:hypothetical protein
MSICEITLSVRLDQIAMVITTMIVLFGAPYIVRSQNKKSLDLKADKTIVDKIEHDLKSKSSVRYVDEKCLDIKLQLEKDQDEIKKTLRDLTIKTDKILTLMIENK